MPGIEDWVNKPLVILQHIFEHSSPSECEKNVREYFVKKLSNADCLSKVPSLNDSPLHELHAGSLVRLRCMIQDMFDPEYFLGTYEVIHIPSQKRYMRLGMYKDVLDCQNTEEVDMDSPRNKTMDRSTFYCISVPGENDWVRKGYSETRLQANFPTTSTVPSRQKRSLDASASEDCERPMETSVAGESAENDNKRSKLRDDSSLANSVDGAALPQDLNLPLPNAEGIACIIKLYDPSNDLKVNDVVEVVGVLSVDPSLAHVSSCFDSSTGTEMESGGKDDEIQAHDLPPSLVPRIHAVTARKLDHTNPHLPWDLAAPRNKQLVEGILSGAGEVRAELHAVLTMALMGDSLAAEYLLCHLVSGIYVRRDVIALGKFALNLSCVPLHDDYNSRLYSLLQQIVTRSCFLPLSLENLNTYAFTPKKDYAKNRLVSGILQLPVHTHMVLDETALAVGRLETQGVRNVTALGNLIGWQRVDYDFGFHRTEYPADVATLVLSEGKSLLPSDCRVPLRPVGVHGSPASVFEGIRAYLTDDLLRRIRCYLTALKLVHFTMSETLQKLVQEDFVSTRQQDASFGADDLHSLLVLARFVSLSVGERSLTRESWEKAKMLERERKRRIQ